LEALGVPSGEEIDVAAIVLVYLCALIFCLIAQAAISSSQSLLSTQHMHRIPTLSWRMLADFGLQCSSKIFEKNT
jgi:hypothetical protein